jgi:hypothetical protein
MLIRSPGGEVWWQQYKIILASNLTETMDEHRLKNSTRPNIVDLLPYFFEIDQQLAEDDDA